MMGVGFNLISIRISVTRHRSEANSSFNALFSAMRYWRKSASTGRSSLTVVRVRWALLRCAASTCVPLGVQGSSYHYLVSELIRFASALYKADRFF